MARIKNGPHFIRTGLLAFLLFFGFSGSAISATIYGDFGSNGLWKYDGSAWTQLSIVNPIHMTSSGSLLYGDFGSSQGIWKYNGSAWTQITPNSAYKIVATGSLLYADFGPAGVYSYNGSWTKLASAADEISIPDSGFNLNITTNGDNTAVGVSALSSNITGFDNTAIGSDALKSNTGGYENTATGYVALYHNTTGSCNTASGVGALYNNTTGYENTATGFAALQSNTTCQRRRDFAVNLAP